MKLIHDSIAGAIGNTPLVELSRIAAGLDGRILMKLEYLNPGLSKKDRAALRIVEEAETSGALKPGQTVIELTSGNMGTGLAIVCAVKGYPFVAVMSKGNSTERARMMHALGAEVILVDQCQGSKPGEVSGDDLKLVDIEAVRLTSERNAFRADQFEHEGNRRAHYFGTAPEIWEQSGGEVTAFCDFAGSGGTFAGCSRYFKETDPGIGCYVVEPEDAATLSGSGVTNPDTRSRAVVIRWTSYRNWMGLSQMVFSRCLPGRRLTAPVDWRKKKVFLPVTRPARTWQARYNSLKDRYLARPLP